MLLDRGLIVREGDAYRPTGKIETLEVPETLQALIAARLDGLAPEERGLLQDASVLGRTFTVPGLGAMTGLQETELEPILGALVRKEVLSLSSDPLSPERGQYGFLQDLVKKVAYDTMSRRERKARHLAAATHLASVTDEDEIAEVVAAHLLDAYRAAPDDPDAADVRVRARTALTRAGERAASLGARSEAQRHFERAAELADEPSAQAELLEQAGVMAADRGPRRRCGVAPRAVVHPLRAGGPASSGRARLGTHRRARLEPRSGRRCHRAHGALVRRAGRRGAGRVVRDARGAAGTLPLLLRRGRRARSSGSRSPSTWRRRYDLPEVLSQALNTKALTLIARERRREGVALLRHALEIALDHELPSAALRAYYNLADVAIHAGASHDGQEFVHERACACTPGGKPLLGVVVRLADLSVAPARRMGRGARHDRGPERRGCRARADRDDLVPRTRPVHPRQQGPARRGPISSRPLPGGSGRRRCPGTVRVCGRLCRDRACRGPRDRRPVDRDGGVRRARAARHRGAVSARRFHPRRRGRARARRPCGGGGLAGRSSSSCHEASDPSTSKRMRDASARGWRRKRGSRRRPSSGSSEPRLSSASSRPRSGSRSRCSSTASGWPAKAGTPRACRCWKKHGSSSSGSRRRPGSSAWSRSQLETLPRSDLGHRPATLGECTAAYRAGRGSAGP